MQNVTDEIHFDCPNCKRPMSGDKTLLGEMINCPDCSEPFFPVPRKEVFPPEPEKTKASQSQPSPSILRKPDITRAEKIRSQADRFAVLAALFCGIGLLIILAAVVQSLSGGSDTGIWFLVSASLIGAAFWLYLIAQIIHIRANTEK